MSIWQGSATVAELVQVALITRVLGLDEYGRFALVIAFVTLVGQFLRVRVGYTAITFGSSALDTDRRSAAGIFQYCYRIDFATSVTALVVISILAPVIGPGLVGSAGVELMPLFALTLIAAFPDETSIAILRLFDRFKLVAIYSAAIDAARVVLLLVSLLVFESLLAVVFVLIAGKLARGTVSAVLAAREFNASSGDARLWAPAIRSMATDERRAVRKNLFHTSFITYGRISQHQLPTLLLGALTGPLETGVYKIGTAAGAILGRLVDPASAALLPRLTRLWSAGNLRAVRRVVLSASIISVPAMLVLLAGLVLLREPALRILGGEAATAAGTVLILAAAAQALYGALFWHTSILLAARRAAVVSALTVTAGAIQVAALLILVPEGGATGAATALLLSQAVMNLVLASLALRMLQRKRFSAAVKPAEAIVAEFHKPR